MFKIHYSIRMMSGVLTGLVLDCYINYPESSKERVVRDFEKDIKDERQIRGIGNSTYVILSYWIEEGL